MKIAYIAAGAANMYCGTCLHDNTLASSLRAAGHDVLLVPTYTPIRTDEENVSISRVFFGGINVYLQQKSALFRHTPWCVDSLLDSRPLMRWLSNRRASVDPKQLGEITVSMLKGEEGRQRKELAKLVRWLRREQPDVVHLSNAMLISMAPRIRRYVKAAIVCGLSGEDVFLEQLDEPHYSRARDLLRRHAAEASAYVALNRYYADFMTGYMDLDPDRVHVIPHGLLLDGHGRIGKRAEKEAYTIGYFARVCPEKGFHLLVDAFNILNEDPSLPPLKLVAAGYLADDDRPYFEEHRGRLASWGLADRFTYLGEPDRAEKIRILQSFDCMSVPTVYRESKGLSVLEAMANGVPVVQPAHGAFPELIEDTGGGLLFEPEDPVSLADAMRRLIKNPALAEELGGNGHHAVQHRYHADAMAENTLRLYEELCRDNGQGAVEGARSVSNV